MEFNYITINIENPGNQPIIPVGLPPGVEPPTDINYVENYLPYLITGHKGDKEEYTYGYYLASQIPKVIKMLKEGGYETNQAYMAVGDMNSIDQEDPPCLRGIQVRIIEGKLNFFVYFRSWDLWTGFPPNLAAIQLMKEYMVSELNDPNIKDGEIVASSGGLHLYEYAWSWAEAYIAKRIEDYQNIQH